MMVCFEFRATLLLFGIQKLEMIVELSIRTTEGSHVFFVWNWCLEWSGVEIDPGIVHIVRKKMCHKHWPL